MGAVDARLSRSRACGRKASAREARDISQAATLLFALFWTSLIEIFCGNFATETHEYDELIALADEKGPFTGRRMHIAARLSFGPDRQSLGRGSNHQRPGLLHVGQQEHQCSRRHPYRTWQKPVRNLANSMTLGAASAKQCRTVATTKESWFEAEAYRIAGEIALLSPEPDINESRSFFRACSVVARNQQAKSWELRAAMSLARLWRDQGKVQQARELLAPVYGWFTEGFDTRDLKEAKALLEELAA